MTTAERREAILAQLGRKPIAARTLAAKYGVSRQVIVQDLAVLRAAHPNVISTARGYVRQQAQSACTREFKVRHTPAQTGLELNLIVDCGGRVCSTSISHRVYGRITVELDIRSRQDVLEFLQALRRDTTTIWWWQPPPSGLILSKWSCWSRYLWHRCSRGKNNGRI